MKLTIGTQEYELRMRMYACRNYKKATGKNLYSEQAVLEIFGIEDKKAEPNPELLVEWIFACIQDGLYPKPVEIKSDDVAISINLGKFDFILELIKFFNKERYGLSDEEMNSILEKGKEKNQIASQVEAKG